MSNEYDDIRLQDRDELIADLKEKLRGEPGVCVLNPIYRTVGSLSYRDTRGRESREEDLGKD